MSGGGRGQPHAWLRKTSRAADIVNGDDDNRMISFPYAKLMVANNAVNQGAAVIVASLAVARESASPRIG